MAANDNYRQIDWAAIVRAAEAGQPQKPEPAYEFSSGRTFHAPVDGGGAYSQ